jgi:hypothetical protein
MLIVNIRLVYAANYRLAVIYVIAKHVTQICQKSSSFRFLISNGFRARFQTSTFTSSPGFSLNEVGAKK